MCYNKYNLFKFYTLISPFRLTQLLARMDKVAAAAVATVAAAAASVVTLAAATAATAGTPEATTEARIVNNPSFVNRIYNVIVTFSQVYN